MIKKIKVTILILLLVLTFLFVGNRYFDFVAKTIYEESSAHLSEIFHQANLSLHNLVANNLNSLHTWEPHVTKSSDEETSAYVELLKQEAGFTDFYFINRDGEYFTADGRVGYLNLKEKLDELVEDKKDIVISSVVPGQPEIMVFAAPCRESSFKGFRYNAIAVSFNNSDLVKSLDINAFNNRSSAYLIHPDGRVIIDNKGTDGLSIYNFLGMLTDKSNLSKEEIDALQKEFEEGKSGVTTFDVSGTEYYLSYESAAFDNWTTLGMVEVDIVNASMNKLQETTMVVVTTIALIVFMAALGYIFRRYNSSLKEKDSEIIYREELFSTLSTNVDDVFMMIDADDMHVDYLSPNVERLLGIKVETAIQNIFSMKEILKGTQSESILDQLGSLQLGEQKDWAREYRHATNLDYRFFTVTAICRGINGKKKYIVVFSDRTEEKRINQDLEYAVAQAQSASRAKSAFLSNMSHDIRTPMNAIIGFTTLAEANIDSKEKVQDYLGKIGSSCSHLLGLINDILDMSRIESGKVKLEEEALNLSELIRDIKTMITGQVNAKQLEFTVETESVRDHKVLCDKTRLSQVLLNLLSNAVKFTEPGGKVSLEVVQLLSSPEGKGSYEFRVKDNGIGMSEDFAKRIFEPFERERTSTVSKIQGTGLGMSISKNLVEMMGGYIDLVTQKGVGTEFIVRLDLPLQKEEGSAKPSDADKSLSADIAALNPAGEVPLSELFNGREVLLAEDNELNREIAIEILKSYGLSIDYAENGRLALEKLEEKSYDLVLMDIQMPVMDGYETTKRIRKLQDSAKASVPIVAMTANAFDEDRAKALDAGMNGFISKPIDTDALLSTLKEFI